MERKVMMPLPPDGKIGEAIDVPITESTERWTDVKLEDGTVLRVKPAVLSAARVPGVYDPEGNPMYVIKASNTMMISEVSEIHKKPKSENPKKAN